MSTEEMHLLSFMKTLNLVINNLLLLIVIHKTNFS